MAYRRAHGARVARRRLDRAARRRRRTAVLVVAALAVVIMLFLAAFGSSPSSRPALPEGYAAGAPAGRPLPLVIALQGSLNLRLPVSQQALTALGYHGAGEETLALEPVGRQANEGLFARIFHRIFGGGGGGVSYYQLGGGDGPSTGALDVGAPAGTDVYAPVDGTIVSIRDYTLDGKAYGHRIDIRPSEVPSVVVSVSRLRADPALTVGAPVAAAGTKVGVVVDLSIVERQALARHTGEPGNHITLEVHPAATLSLR